MKTAIAFTLLAATLMASPAFAQRAMWQDPGRVLVNRVHVGQDPDIRIRAELRQNAGFYLGLGF